MNPTNNTVAADVSPRPTQKVGQIVLDEPHSSHLSYQSDAEFNCRLSKRQLNSDVTKLRHRMIRRARGGRHANARARLGRWFMRQAPSCEREFAAGPSGLECGKKVRRLVRHANGPRRLYEQPT